MPAFLKLSLQQKVAAQVAADLGAAVDFVRSGSPELLRGKSRRYFGSQDRPVFRSQSLWVRRRGLGGL